MLINVKIQTICNSGFVFFLLKQILHGLNYSWDMSTCLGGALGDIPILSASVAFVNPAEDEYVLCLIFPFMLVQVLLLVNTVLKYSERGGVKLIFILRL